MSEAHWIAQLLADCEKDVSGYASEEEFRKAAVEVQEMADKSERLQAQATWPAMLERVERLQAEVERLRTLLREIEEASRDDDSPTCQHYTWINDTAKEALLTKDTP